MKRRRFALDIRPGAVALLAGLYFLLPLRWCVRLALAVVVHELGHVAALWSFGGRVRGVSLELGGLHLDARLPAEGWKEALCSLAGPAAGLLWSAVAAWMGGERWLYVSGLSALLSLFNLLPCLPLDGGRALLAATGSETLLRWGGLVSVGLLLWTGFRWKLWFSLIPALWLLGQQFLLAWKSVSG